MSRRSCVIVGSVRGDHRVTELLEDRVHLADGNRSALLHVVRQILAGEIFHHEERKTRPLIDARDLHFDDVLAVDVRADAGLLLEPAAQRRVGDELRMHQLQRARCSSRDLLDLVDGTHAALPERLHDPVVTGKDGSRIQRDSHCYGKRTFCGVESQPFELGDVGHVPMVALPPRPS